MEAFDALLAGLPIFMAHSVVSLVILFVGIYIYMMLTAHDEMALIRGGNVAAALSLGGAAVGLAIPLAVSLSVSLTMLDLVLWGAVALVFQLVAFRVMDLFLKDLPTRIEEGDMAAAVLLVSAKLSIAFINAAAISG